MTVEGNRSGPIPPEVDRAIARGAEAASAALSRWLGRPAQIAVSRVRLAAIDEAIEALGPGEAVVASCALPLEGRLPGTVLMTFEERSVMALIDALLGRPEGAAAGWGELERSVAQETTNIVACAFVGALAEALHPGGTIVPGPPEFRIEFAGSLLQFALIDQAALGGPIVLVETRFSVDGIGHDWAMVIVPASGGLGALGLGDGGMAAGPTEGRP